MAYVKICVDNTGNKFVLKFSVEIYACLVEAKYSNTMEKKQERKTQTLIMNDVNNEKVFYKYIIMLIMECFLLYIIIFQSCWCVSK